MSQSSSATTLLKAPEISLKGGLQSVLQSLDVQLEDELIRYRRERRRQAQAEKLSVQQMLAAAPAAQAPAASDSAAAKALTQDAAAPGDNLSAAPGDNLSADHPSADHLGEPSELMRGASATAKLGGAELNGTQLAETQSGGDSLGGSEVGADGAIANSSSLALVRRVEDTDTTGLDDEAEEDYFASSAALLESLDAMPEEDLEGLQRPSEETSFLKQLMTPAGVGASLLVLAAGAASGYLMMNPDSVSHLRFSELFAQAEVPEAADATEVAATQIPAELPPGAPDLTQREFIQLSLSNLGSLDPDGNPIHSQSSLSNLLGLSNGGLTVAAAQPLPGSVNGAAPGIPGITQSAGGGGTAPGGAATLPNVIQPIPQSGLLSSLSNAVSGRTTAEQMIAATPLPAIVSPTAPVPAPAAVAAAPVIQPMEVTQLPVPAPAPAPIAPPAPVAAPAPAESYIEEYIPPAPEAEAEISYWEAEPEATTQPVAPDPVVEEPYAAAESESYGQATYIVLAPYISDAALADIQAVVPDAYVENYDTGAYIQAGVFDDAASAGDLLMRLQEQGISASVENR